MLETYQGILHGDRIEWSGEAPPSPIEGTRLRVSVSVLDQTTTPTTAERGRRMAAALERLATDHALESIPDPSSWEREVREELPLPRREP